MKIKVIGFGSVSDIFPAGLYEIEDESTTAELVKTLSEQYPPLGKMRFVIAVDERIVRKKTKLKDGSEVALLPPFAGG